MYSGKSDGIVFPKSLAFYGKPQRKVMVWTKSDQNPLVNHKLHKIDARFELRHAQNIYDNLQFDHIDGFRFLLLNYWF